MAIDYNIVSNDDGSIRIHSGLLEDNQGIVTGPSGLPVNTDPILNQKYFIISQQGIEYSQFSGEFNASFFEFGYEPGDDPDNGIGGDIIDKYEEHYTEDDGWSDLAYLNHPLELIKDSLPTEDDITINTNVNETQIETGVMIKIDTQTPVIKTENNPDSKHGGVLIKREGKKNSK